MGTERGRGSKVAGPLRLLLGFAILAVVLWRSGFAGFGPVLRAAPWLVLVFAGQGLLGVMLEAFRLRVLVRSQQVALTYAAALRTCLTAIPFSYVIPGGVGGDVMKVALLSRVRRAQTVEFATIALVDRVIGLTALLTVATTAAGLGHAWTTAPAGLRSAAVAAAAGLAAIVAGTAILWSRRGSNTRLGTWMLERMPGHRLASRLWKALGAFQGHGAAIGSCFALTVAGYLLLAALFVLASGVVMPGVPAGTVVWVSLLAMVANVIPLTPGGLGVGEAAFAVAFSALGYPGGAQLLLLVRIGVVPWAVLGALLYAIAPVTPATTGDAHA